MSKRTKKILIVLAIVVVGFIILSMLNVAHQREVFRQAQESMEMME